MKTYPREQCCFATGHREIDDRLRSRICRRIRSAVTELIRRGVVHFYAGGANGFDLWFSCVILDLKREYPQITLTVLLPDKDYTAHWTGEERMCMKQILAACDEKAIVQANGKEPALARNDALIALGQYGIAYLKGNRLTRRGGTSYTVRHALRANCTMLMLAREEDSDGTKNR